MIDPAVIFQRTQAGRDEIYQKSGGLTQSERLVLIMVDGVAPYQGVRNKLPALTDERFSRAFQKLLQKELVLEVFMPLESQAAEELDKTVIDRFLQQDPMDPVTIMMIDPDEQFDFMDSPAPKHPEEMPRTPLEAVPETVAAMPAPTPPAEAPIPEELERLAEEVEKEVRALHSERQRENPMPPPSPAPHADCIQPIPQEQVPAPGYFHWGYLLIGIGLAFILGFVLNHLVR